MKHVRNNQAGFSLVELMVVVAIIGILASLAIPSIGKYMAKARQSEAKTQLSSLYTAEKAFFAEYTTYDNRFGALGYSPEGKLRYVVGFTGGTVAGPANGYNTPLAGTQLMTSTLTFCGTGGVITAVGCTLLNGANGAAPTALANTSCPAIGATTPANCTTAANTFNAGASAIIHQIGTIDQWQMDHNKNLINSVAGIP